MLPNLIIPGAQKAGTSSLFECLSQHPQCAGSQPKEPTFFSLIRQADDLTAYASYFPEDIAEKRITFEASTSYLAESYVPQRIHQALGDQIKFLMILRQPVERAISAYWHTAKRLDEHRPIDEVFDINASSLEEACAIEDARVEQAIRSGRIKLSRYIKRYDDPAWPFRYLQNSFYTQALGRYLEYFSRSSLHIVTLEAFKSEPESVWAGISQFLDINPIDLGRGFAQANTTRVPRNRLLTQVVRSIPAGVMPRQVRQRMEQALSQSKPAMAPALCAHLNQLFADEIAALEARFDIRFSPKQAKTQASNFDQTPQLAGMSHG